MTALVDAALDAARLGWRVFPLAPGRKTPRRAARDWEHKATDDSERVSRWWTRHPFDNVGIATGPSGLVVVDLDVPKPGDGSHVVAGVQVLEQLAVDHGQALAATWTVTTPSGGRHRYHCAPAGRQLRNTAGRIGPKIDTRANGGYVVAAGSVVAGVSYELVDDTPPIDLPGWMLQLLDPPQVPPHVPTRPSPRARGYIEAVLAGEVRRVLDAPPGTRNDTLNRSAWSVGRLVAQGVIPRHVAESALQAAGEAAGLTAHEAAATVQSSLNARLRRPGAAR